MERIIITPDMMQIQPMPDLMGGCATKIKWLPGYSTVPFVPKAECMITTPSMARFTWKRSIPKNTG